MFNKNYISLLAFICICLIACNNDDKKNTSETSKKDTTSTKNIEQNNIVKPPTINILDTISVARTIICLKDSSATIEGVGLKLGAIYGLISKDVIAKNKLIVTGQPMAWYKTNKAPYFFEAGIPVAKATSKLGKGMFVKEIKADSATVAHFYGPYTLLSQGYDAIKERLKDNKKIAKGAPYEIYVSDPIDAAGKPIDPYKVRTDIVFPWR